MDSSNAAFQVMAMFMTGTSSLNDLDMPVNLGF